MLEKILGGILLKKKVKAVLAGALAITLLTGFTACKNNAEDTAATADTTVQEKAVIPVNPLTNSLDYSATSVGKRPIAFVINNQPQARPQWGLNSADAVFEFPVEGMITRMMWVFADYDKLPEKIGPLRSARHHFVYTAGSLDAIYIHWGGSTMGYQAIEDNNIDDIDAMKYGDGAGKYFYRDKTRSVAIEHRGITDGQNVREVIDTAITRQTLKDGKVGAPFLFAKKEASSAEPCTSLSVSFSADFNRSFKYDAGEKLYYNSMNGSAFCDGNDDTQNAMTNVVVLYAPVTTLANELVDVDLTGGTGLYVTNGTYAKIKWTKGNNTTDQLQLYYDDGTPVELNSGKTWFNMIPDSRQSKTVIN